MSAVKGDVEGFMAFREKAARAKRLSNGRVCTGCKTWKPSDQFRQSMIGVLGITPRCKPCFAADARKRRARNGAAVRRMEREARRLLKLRRMEQAEHGYV